MKRLQKRRLHIHEILAWADAYRAAAGRWPTNDSGDIVVARFETWSAIDQALRLGLRGLPGGSSLALLLAEERDVRNIRALPRLTVETVLRWADEHHQRTGSWPTGKSGRIPGSGGENWGSINQALANGARGLPRGSSLARLLAQYRGKRNHKQLPPLTEQRILEWADLHFQRTGAWPNQNSGPIADAPGQTWGAVDQALSQGIRGLPGGSSLPRLLTEQRGVKPFWDRPVLSNQDILAWADAFRARSGKWPTVKSGAVPEAAGTTWVAIDLALAKGLRGLPGGSSLAKLLAAERGVRNAANLPRLSCQRILDWAKAHFRRTGTWPTKTAGPIPETTGETWLIVDKALSHGRRGLPGGSSLARFLAQHGLKRNLQDQPPLSKRKILTWADAHFQRMGQWPTHGSGPVMDAPGERWDTIDTALMQGHRGLPGGSSLRRLLVKKRGVRPLGNLPPLTEGQILVWAELHFRRTGSWPSCHAGPIEDAPGETWSAVESALRQGSRGLPGGSSLAQCLAQVKNGQPVPSAEEDCSGMRTVASSENLCP